MSETLQRAVAQCISPAFDDLFDDVEEAMLLTLIPVARQFISYRESRISETYFSNLTIQKLLRQILVPTTANCSVD